MPKWSKVQVNANSAFTSFVRPTTILDLQALGCRIAYIYINLNCSKCISFWEEVVNNTKLNNGLANGQRPLQPRLSMTFWAAFCQFWFCFWRFLQQNNSSDEISWVASKARVLQDQARRGNVGLSTLCVSCCEFRVANLSTPHDVVFRVTGFRHIEIIEEQVSE